MYNSKSEPKCKPWTLGDNDMSVEVHQPQQMYHSGGGDADKGEAVCMCGGGVGKQGCMGNLCISSLMLLWT